MGLLLGVLPYAQKVTIGLLGRGLPHFYICHCGQYQFTLVLSGWTKNDWAKGSAFDLLVPQTELSPGLVERVYNYLVVHLSATQGQIATYIDGPLSDVEYALFQLCRAGRVIYDLTTGRYRCPFFENNLMSRGPCEHILAARLALDQYLRQNKDVDALV
ncbi:MAG: hypothetical protein L0Y56_01490, partial [Nitrospira sp.]|nr:hypothetical protein [Nitrospira sp.]